MVCWTNVVTKKEALSNADKNNLEAYVGSDFICKKELGVSLFFMKNNGRNMIKVSVPCFFPPPRLSGWATWYAFLLKNETILAKSEFILI